MRFFENDTLLLLISLLVFGLGVVFLRFDGSGSLSTTRLSDLEFESEVQKRAEEKKLTAADTRTKVEFDYGYPKTDLTEFSQEELLNYMRPLFLTKSASAIISFLNHIPVASVYKIVKAVIESPKLHLPARVKLRVIFAGVQRQKDKEKKFEFFDLVAQNQHLQTGVKPLIVKAVDAGYAHLVPDILEWADQLPHNNVVHDALFYVAHYDDEDPEALRELFEAGVSIGRSVASELLWELVDTCSCGYSIPFLVRELSADINQSKNGVTPLVRAVQGNKQAIVRLLLEFGARPATRVTLSASERTPLEVARDMKNEEMITLLMSHT
jgi:hypothetical protein